MCEDIVEIGDCFLDMKIINLDKSSCGEISAAMRER